MNLSPRSIALAVGNGRRSGGGVRAGTPGISRAGARAPDRRSARCGPARNRGGQQPLLVSTFAAAGVPGRSDGRTRLEGQHPRSCEFGDLRIPGARQHALRGVRDLRWGILCRARRAEHSPPGRSDELPGLPCSGEDPGRRSGHRAHQSSGPVDTRHRTAVLSAAGAVRRRRVQGSERAGKPPATCSIFRAGVIVLSQLGREGYHFAPNPRADL